MCRDASTQESRIDVIEIRREFFLLVFCELVDYRSDIDLDRICLCDPRKDLCRSTYLQSLFIHAVEFRRFGIVIRVTDNDCTTLPVFVIQRQHYLLPMEKDVIARGYPKQQFKVAG